MTEIAPPVQFLVLQGQQTLFCQSRATNRRRNLAAISDKTVQEATARQLLPRHVQPLHRQHPRASFASWYTNGMRETSTIRKCPSSGTGSRSSTRSSSQSRRLLGGLRLRPRLLHLLSLALCVPQYDCGALVQLQDSGDDQRVHTKYLSSTMVRRLPPDIELQFRISIGIQQLLDITMQPIRYPQE